MEICPSFSELKPQKVRASSEGTFLNIARFLFMSNIQKGGFRMIQIWFLFENPIFMSRKWIKLGVAPWPIGTPQSAHHSSALRRAPAPGVWPGSPGVLRKGGPDGAEGDGGWAARPLWITLQGGAKMLGGGWEGSWLIQNCYTFQWPSDFSDLSSGCSDNFGCSMSFSWDEDCQQCWCEILGQLLGCDRMAGVFLVEVSWVERSLEYNTQLGSGQCLNLKAAAGHEMPHLIGMDRFRMI